MNTRPARTLFQRRLRLRALGMLLARASVAAIRTGGVTMKRACLWLVAACLFLGLSCLIPEFVPTAKRDLPLAAPAAGLPAVPARVANVATGAGTQPEGVAFDSFHQTMWVALALTNTVNEYSLTAPYALLKSVGVNNPYGLVFDPGNYTLWVTGSTGAVVSVVDTNTGAVAAVLATGTHPAQDCFDGSNVWVPNFGANTLSPYLANPPTAGVALGALGLNPHSCVFDGTNLWVTLEFSNAVEQLDVATGATAAFGSGGSMPWGIAFDGGPCFALWVANQGSNNAVALNTAGVILNTIPVGPGPRGVVYGIGAGVAYVWVINNNNNGPGTLTQIDVVAPPTCGTFSGTSAAGAIGTAPQFGAFDPINNHIWVANSLSNTVTILK